MNNALFEKTGIKLTDAQMRILKKLFRGLVAAAALALVLLAAGFGMHFITLNCAETIATTTASGARDMSCFNQAHMIGDWVFGVIAVLFVLVFVPFITDGASYLAKLASRREFREQEMAASVDYVEEDEREQLITMRATRRAYMVINFTLLVFWLVSLVTGNIGAAVTLFIVQAIGALSYRRERSTRQF